MHIQYLKNWRDKKNLIADRDLAHEGYLKTLVRLSQCNVCNQSSSKIDRVSTHSDVQCGSARRQRSFSGRDNVRIKLPFSGHIASKFRRPTILQLNIEGLTESKINVLHHLAMQSEALVILLQETHCTNAEKLVLPNY